MVITLDNLLQTGCRMSPKIFNKYLDSNRYHQKCFRKLCQHNQSEGLSQTFQTAPASATHNRAPGVRTREHEESRSVLSQTVDAFGKELTPYQISS